MTDKEYLTEYSCIKISVKVTKSLNVQQRLVFLPALKLGNFSVALIPLTYKLNLLGLQLFCLGSANTTISTWNISCEKFYALARNKLNDILIRQVQMQFLIGQYTVVV